MLTNLFSSFDPSTSSSIQMNWMMMIMPVLILPKKFWLKNSRSTSMMKTINKLMMKEMKFSKDKQMKLMLLAVFKTILMMNILSIPPYTFTPTSHMVISMTLALPLWMSLMTFGWTKSTNLMFAHTLPSGTPPALMPFMILIETISNIIRPLSLAIRLTANMIAGHLLMTLLGNLNEMNTIPMIMIMQMTLMTFESSISIIQAYVFTVLMTLYSSEIP
nr:ATP synthase F0 subunit 6 [Borysthenes sp. 2 WQW-2023a]